MCLQSSDFSAFLVETTPCKGQIKQNKTGRWLRNESFDKKFKQLFEQQQPATKRAKERDIQFYLSYTRKLSSTLVKF